MSERWGANLGTGRRERGASEARTPPACGFEGARNGRTPYWSASWTFPTIFAPGFTSVLSPSSFHFEGQTSFVFLAM